MRKTPLFLTIALLGEMAVASSENRDRLDLDQPHVHVDLSEFAGPVPTTFASTPASGSFVEYGRI